MDGVLAGQALDRVADGATKSPRPQPPDFPFYIFAG